MKTNCRAHLGTRALCAFLLVAASGLSWGGSEAPTAAADGAADIGIPLPLDKTTILRPMDKPYVIDGACVIGPAVEITVERQVRIVGVNNASLDVQGGLKMHGTQDNWVRIENVDFSPTKDTKKGVRLDCCDMHGCKFKHAEGQSFSGSLQIENCCFQRDCEFDVVIVAGSLRIIRVEWGIACRVRLEPPKGKPVPADAIFMSSWLREVFVTGPGMVALNHCETRGVELRQFTVAAVDGCELGGRTAFLQRSEDSFEGLTLLNCNVWEGGEVVFERPKGEDTKAEKVKLEKFFFGPKKTGVGVTADKDVAAIIKDGVDDPNQAIRALWTKPKERPHALMPHNLRVRAPALKDQKK